MLIAIIFITDQEDKRYKNRLLFCTDEQFSLHQDFCSLVKKKEKKVRTGTIWYQTTHTQC